MTIAERIKAARKMAGLTQKELGKRMGLSDASIAQYESGQRYPKIQTLQRIATALDVPISHLLSGVDHILVGDDAIFLESAPAPLSDISELKKQIQRRKDNGITGNMRITMQKGADTADFAISAFESDKLKIIFMMIDDGWKVIDGGKYDVEVWEEIPDTPDE